ncbi:TPR-like protein [Bimuria novae-zelandiae CBS 107.79]|uniref:TPR-like protein n=1 Tax=Bimuria novae-zelandiae CBS 107.79 TaxID=1447943 RepID=A0A6A5V472_9PLEO|nr:TPR-like protein [Bimuria novae-zelandiae CBS 107.79]
MANFGDRNAGFQAGNIFGSVTNTFHAPPERRETPPQPSIVIPFARDAHFVERGTLLDELCKKCALPDARHAVVGLGGVGKSQLAIEHAYRTRRQDPQINIFKLVHGWLCDSKQPWLLVLDNVDDASFLLDAETASSQTAARPLREYLPHCKHGSILITSRSKEAARKLVEQRDIIRLDPMDEAQSLALLARKLGAPADNSSDMELAELAAALKCMPLAIVQAAAYISQRAPLCSLRRDREAKNSIIATWQISFEHIQQTRPSAVDLLSLMSFFDRQGIPRGVLQLQAKHDKVKIKGSEPQFRSKDGDSENNNLRDYLDNKSSHNDLFEDDSFENDFFEDDNLEDDAFNDDVTVLRNFCFVSANTNGASFEMHALVQLSMRTWLATNGNNLYAAFPTGEYENWAACQALFAHAKAAASQKPEAASSLIEWATLLYRAAWYAVSKGSAGEAEALAIQSMKDTVWSIAIMADAYSLSGRWDEAEKLRGQVVETRKKKLGADHPDTLTSIANLASTYRNQGRWDAAEELEVQVMETFKKKLGADHPDTLTSMANLAMANLASTYRNQGRWDAAEELFVQVIETRKKKLGADHPSTLTSMSNLASTYRNQGRWDTAEELEVQVMETRKKKLGADHPDTLTSMANLAWTWKSLERSAKAISLQQECVRLRCQILPAGHPDLVSSSKTLSAWEAEQAVSTLTIRL